MVEAVGAKMTAEEFLEKFPITAEDL
jgi:uncharacterized protein (DUF433 family)